MVTNPPANAGDVQDTGSLVGKIPWGRKWEPTPVFFLRIPQRSQQATVHRVRESDTTERAHMVRGASPSVHLAARVSVF